MISSIVGTILTRAAGALVPLGVKDDPAGLKARKIACSALYVVDAKANLHAGLNTFEFGGSECVPDKRAGAGMRVNKPGNGDFSSWDENGNRLK